MCVSATSPNAGSELEQARPQTSGEEELQLQLALAMSREAAEQVRIQVTGTLAPKTLFILLLFFSSSWTALSSGSCICFTDVEV